MNNIVKEWKKDIKEYFKNITSEQIEKDFVECSYDFYKDVKYDLAILKAINKL